MEYETVIYESSKKIGYITLNRPEKHNALSYQLLDDLDAVLDEAEADEKARVIILKANGKSFCSGFDLKGSYYLTPPEGGWKYKNSYDILNKKIYAKYLRLFNFPKPTIAQVHGYCTDAGCYLQLLCDISVAAEDAIFGHPAQRWGGAQSMPLWQFYLGVKKARYLLMTGRTINGIEAEKIGLISLSVPKEQLEEEVNKIAQEISEIPPDGALHNKICLNTDLKIRGLDALFDYYGQMNRYTRFVLRK
ncbi:MAG: enoyl-CoA hydratase/isomerase family protein [Candidatus Lokiarchaeota archaeon]|nr:enoyl-CoA hydratase/isomerase family protein [Candidatus Lokiarchaeota archaeon]